MNSKYNIDFLGIKISGSSWTDVYSIVGILLLVFTLSAVWCVRDARRRNKNGFLAFIFLSTACWPVSILFWLWLRPRTAAESEATQIRNATDDCPRCGTSLSGRTSCRNCHWERIAVV